MDSMKFVSGLLCALTLILSGCNREASVPKASNEAEIAAAGAQSGHAEHPAFATTFETDASSTAFANDVAQGPLRESNPSSDPSYQSGNPYAPRPYPEGAQQALQAPVSDKILAAETAAFDRAMEADRSGPAYDSYIPAPSLRSEQAPSIDPETGH